MANHSRINFDELAIKFLAILYPVVMWWCLLLCCIGLRVLFQKSKKKNHLLNRSWAKCCVAYESNILVWRSDNTPDAWYLEILFRVKKKTTWSLILMLHLTQKSTNKLIIEARENIHRNSKLCCVRKNKLVIYWFKLIRI